MHDDLVERLEMMPHTLEEAISGIEMAMLDHEMPGHWSARTVIAHLRDDESLVMRQRLERMLAEDGPVFPNFDEKAWATWRNRDRDDIKHLLRDFAVQRQASVNLLRFLSPAQWQRTGRHETDGEYTVLSWAQHWAEHDTTHLEQIREAIDRAGVS